VLGTVLSVLFGLVLEKLLFRHFYHRDHLDQVLLTFGLIYIFEEMRSILWGDERARRPPSRRCLSPSIPPHGQPVVPGLPPVHVGPVHRAGDRPVPADLEDAAWA
jgi:hypothetical protein